MKAVDINNRQLFRVDLKDDTNVDYWCSRLNCSKELLTYCVMKVGSSANAVKDYMEMNQYRFDKCFDLIWKEIRNN